VNPARRLSSSSRLAPCGALAAIALVALAGAAQAETLADAIGAAYDRNPSLVGERYIQRARDEDYVQARSGYGPTLSVQATGGYDYLRSGGRTQQGDGGEFRATVSQPLYTSGRLRGAVAAARAGVQAGEQSLRRTEQQVIQAVIEAYASVLRDQARLDVGREALEVLRGQYQQNSTRQQKGDVTLTDVSQSAARLAEAEVQMGVLEADLATSRGRYLEIVGHNPGNLEPLPQLPAAPPSIDTAIARADSDNPDLLGARYSEQSSSANAASVRGQRGPTISLTGQATYSNRLLRFDGRDGSKELYGGFTISQPLLTGGAIQSRIRQADAQNLADQAAIDGARRAARQDVTQAWSQLASSRTALVAGQRQVDAAQQAFAGMRCEELNGLRSTIETLNAQRELQSAQNNLLQSRYGLYVSHAALLAAMGGLSAQSIAANIAVYDPDANFRAVRNRGVTPLDYVAIGLDRMPAPNVAPALPARPDERLVSGALTPIRDSRLRLSDGRTAQCPLGVGPAR
jgi:outer membrane protein